MWMNILSLKNNFQKYNLTTAEMPMNATQNVLLCQIFFSSDLHLQFFVAEFLLFIPIWQDFKKPQNNNQKQHLKNSE